MDEPRETLPLDEISVELIERTADPLPAFDPEGGISRRAGSLHREIDAAERESREAMDAGERTEHMVAMSERYGYSRELKILTEFAREASPLMREHAPDDVIDRVTDLMRKKIEDKHLDPLDEKAELRALESCRQLFTDEFEKPDSDVLIDPSSD